ncbi:Chromosome partition protein Smc [Rubripirellula lacrimiformis]|uniref:Chromosome partition protein Smc n=1 Tax=Rubripirellula lacrimiformis TaxID=1930273 RepID=A0A517N8E0_9BACT|nr:hypothetical protein [Rubripirellula lacrimiformis]QDT03409.1 Chromosome partition protein Smc [Rubripirellula lacrimiformis]
MQVASRRPKLQIRSPLELAIRGVLARPVYVVCSLIIALLVAAGLATQMRSERYRYVGKMLYSPNRVTEPYYVSPDLRNLTGAVISPSLMTDLYDRWDVPIDFEVFTDRLRFDVSSDAALETAYMSKDEQQARELLQDAMEEFIRKARTFRANSIRQHVDDFQREIEVAAEAKLAADIRLRDKLRLGQVRTIESLTAEMVKIRQSISDAENRIAAALDRQQLSRAQFESMLALQNVERKVPRPSDQDRGDSDDAKTMVSTDEDGDSDEASDEQKDIDSDAASRDLAASTYENEREAIEASYDLQKQKLLEDRIRREKELASFKVRIDVARKEFDRAKLLHERDLISDANFERAKGDLEVLMANQNEQVRQLEEKLLQINGRISGRTDSMPLLGAVAIPGMPLAAAGQSNEHQTIALLRGSEVAADANLQYLESEIQGHKTRLQELVSLQNEIKPLQDDVELADLTLGRLKTRRETFQQASRSGTDELRIVQDATPMINGVSSNATKWFAAGFVAAFGCLITPLFLVSLKSALDRRPETGSSFGLAVLGRAPSRKQFEKNAVTANSEMARIALRICHRLGTSQGVVTLASDDREHAETLAHHVTQVLHGEGRTATTIDSSKLVRSWPVNEVADVHHDPEAGHGVCLRELQQQSDFVLVFSPLFADALQLEQSASRSSGMVLSVPPTDLHSARMQRTIADLATLETPVLGVVVQQ